MMKPEPQRISNPHAAALEERAMSHFGETLSRLVAGVDEVTTRIGKLEGIERRLNYPLLGLLASILAVLVYTAALLHTIAHHLR